MGIRENKDAFWGDYGKVTGEDVGFCWGLRVRRAVAVTGHAMSGDKRSLSKAADGGKRNLQKT